ncbi:nucleoside triphosphate pyrophosphohydrolase family protein [Plectonema cf. radiosum LEGE 06105]|uniref:Nucleoside triphosphate pyrophosphohydrolase family protein n=1 Tax=Plectonema cf. radiosum LEGE 06105 TaxID=945769 RepID=A0A8J7JU76_9CYAN|nr:nucleoside triphosphate pyrophosphohydrolase family protein [Plectonema radiosum]MBE9214709.1 nucleoside triphosphate pyrophosphohydrolase family protein [Plectonema cf. radiosum LEGE 06105]
MDFRNYQEKALQTDQVPSGTQNDKIVPLLGLVGEAGSLLTEYKKHLRDGDSYKLFNKGIAEELGDLLWYVANVASKFDLDLQEIAEDNLKKCLDRWSWKNSLGNGTQTKVCFFDKNFPENERLPRQFEVEIIEVSEKNSVKLEALIDGQRVEFGSELTDNSYKGDGYRYHDVFHLSYLAVLGWSPVIRKLLKRKRRSDSLIDEVEDGGRAGVIEEGISALVFSYAENHDFLEGVTEIDYELLKTIKNMTINLEVSQCSLGEWEKAILVGYEVWRQVNKNKGGKVVVNIDTQSMTYQVKSKFC